MPASDEHTEDIALLQRVAAARGLTAPPTRIFLLSPANCGGARARQVVSPRARFALADRLRSAQGAALGEVFAFVSGLYFRGKLAYARRFAAAPGPGRARADRGVYIITPSAGLRSPGTLVTAAAMRAFADTDVHPDNPAYRRPLERSARALRRKIGAGCDVVLLGSIASPKYVDVLLEIFGAQLWFPAAFVGRGDLSRGGLLLRRVAEGTELEYVALAGAARRGTRPPKLPSLKQTA